MARSATHTYHVTLRCLRHDISFEDVSHFAQFLKMSPPSSDVRTAQFSEYLQNVHFGVLGLSALILSVPYRLPPWIPEAMVLLAEHVNDPEPVRSTIQKTINEFRRTHQDTWHVDRHQFTDEQLQIFSGLLTSPSYYA
jgi:proteasome activator subunit 4